MESSPSQIQCQKSQPMTPDTLEESQTCSDPCIEHWAGEYKFESSPSQVRCQKSQPLLPDTLEESQTCSAPCIEDWAGEYKFEVVIDSAACTRRLWHYSSRLNKVFVDAFDSIPLKFKMNSLDQDKPLFVRAMPVYVDIKNICLPVNRCPFHIKEEEDKGLKNIEHVVRCEDHTAIYDFDPVSKRYSVTVPLGYTQHVVTHMYSFVCKTSCCGGMNRRPITIVFTLEKGQKVVGRRTLNIRVCTRPKRDMEKEEKMVGEASNEGNEIAPVINGEGLIQPCPSQMIKLPEVLEIPMNDLPSKMREEHELSTEEHSGDRDVYDNKEKISLTSKIESPVPKAMSLQILEILPSNIQCQEPQPIQSQTSEKSPSNIHKERDSAPTTIQCQESQPLPFETLETSPTCLLPRIDDWAGYLLFDIQLDSLTCNNESWQTSKSLKEVFVNAFESIPLNFKINSWEKDEPLFLRAMLVYADHQHLCFPVNRCLFHLKEDNDKGFKNIEHVLRCENEFSVYDYDSESERYSVTVPLGCPQSGCDVVTHSYYLVCKNSCYGGMNQRPIMIVFTLEKDKKAVGRKALNVRMCSTPKRVNKEEQTSEDSGEELLQPNPSKRLGNSREMEETQPRTLVKSPTCLLPCMEDWGGSYQFELHVDSSICNKKTWQYSSSLNKVFIDAFEVIPINFKTNLLEEEPLFVRAVPVYVDAQYIRCPVNRCPYHFKEEQNKGLNNIEHVVRCEDQFATYDYDPVSERYSVTVPLGRPPPGCDVVTHMYSMVCKTSCCGGMNRRPVMIIFTLEKANKVVGRRVLNIRVCSIPKRDKEKEEKMIPEANGEGLLQPGLIQTPRISNEMELPISTSCPKKRKLLEFSYEEEVSNEKDNDLVPSENQCQELQAVSSQILEKAYIRSLPCMEEWAGHYQFELLIDKSTSSRKTWQYSSSLNKVFIDAFENISLNFKINYFMKDEPLFVRAMPVYTDSKSICFPVNRCPFHVKEEQDKGLKNIEHVVRCEDKLAVYDYDPFNKRYSVTVPIRNPQPGCGVITHIYSLVCKSSCCGGMNRRPIMIVFTLEKDKKVVGRRGLNIRVCSRPKRDKEIEEKITLEPTKGSLQPHTSQSLRDSKDVEVSANTSSSKKTKLSVGENNGNKEVYNIKVYGSSDYKEVLELLIKLADQEYSKNASKIALHRKEEYSELLKMLKSTGEAH